MGRQAVRLNVIRNSLGLQLQLVQRRLLHQLEESVLLKMGIDLWNAPTQILQIHLLRYSRPRPGLGHLEKHFYFKTGRLNWMEQAKGGIKSEGIILKNEPIIVPHLLNIK